ncbi:MAG: hypothetical protein ACYC36_00135 [Bellilinea sp.]
MDPEKLAGLTEGRMVHFVMPDGQHRAAVIVRVWRVNEQPPENGCSDLMVIPDGSNDAGYSHLERQELLNNGINSEDVKHGHFWRTSVLFSETPVPNTWHWIERA